MLPIYKEVVELQDKFNKQVSGKDWKSKNLNWDRAIWLECAEAIESLDWKWWKHKKSDYENFKVELVDILHFLISEGLEIYDKSIISTLIYKYNLLHYNILVNDAKKIEMIENIVLLSINKRVDRNYRFEQRLQFLITLWDSVSDENILKYYIAKNVLNKFRQDYGYKDGKYNKIWKDKEDNVYVMELLDKYDENVFDNVYKDLEKIYISIFGKQLNLPLKEINE